MIEGDEAGFEPVRTHEGGVQVCSEGEHQGAEFVVKLPLHSR